MSTSSASHTFVTPVGRLVGGDVFTPREKDLEGRPLTTRDNQKRVDYVVQVAFPKSNPETETMRAAIYRVACEAFPTLFPNGQPARPDFSFKWVDGDSQYPNQRGVIPATREGYPGNWVLTFKSSFAPKAYDAQQVPITDPNAIKRGYWVRIACTCKGNNSAQKPGVYLNHSMLQLCGYGEEIHTGPDPATVFAEAAQLPAGASATPLAPTGAMPGAAPPASAPPAYGAPPVGVPMPAPAHAPAMPSGTGAPPVAAPSAVAPAPMMAPPGQAPGAPMPMPFGAPAPAPAPAPPKQTKPGSQYTYEQLVASGWNEDQMRAAGYL